MFVRALLQRTKEGDKKVAEQFKNSRMEEQEKSLENGFLIFAGTSEGRELAAFLAGQKIPAAVCVATEYGEEILPPMPGIRVLAGRMDQIQMEEQMNEMRPLAVIDATHPYAEAVTENIEQACENTKTKYYRLLRAESELKEEPGIRVFDDCESAAEWLNGQTGNILLTTGMKELPVFAEAVDQKDRIYARVLLQEEVFDRIGQYGLSRKQVICMQGPFSAELNLAMLREFQIRFLVTKEAGSTGGFPEKREAAEKAGAVLVVIGRPEEREGFLEEELYAYLKQELSLSDSWELAIVGIGMGAEESLTLEGKKACREAGLLIGARRMLEAAATEGQVTEEAYLPGDILAAVKRHPSIRKAAVVLSGDPGFYSGAKRLLDALQEESGFQIQVIPGISSVSYFCAKLHTSWEDAAVLSLHGREDNLIWAVERHKKTIVLGSGAESVRKICETLKVYGYGALTVNLRDLKGLWLWSADRDGRSQTFLSGGRHP